MAACTRQHIGTTPLLHTPSLPATSILLQKLGQILLDSAQIRSKLRLIEISTTVPPPTTMAHAGGFFTSPSMFTQLMMTHPSPLCLRSVHDKIYRNGAYGVFGVRPGGRPPRLQTNLKKGRRRERRPIVRRGFSYSHQSIPHQNGIALRHRIT